MSRAVATCLREQLARAREVVASRLEGLTDEEFFWQPVANCWTVHPSEGTEHLFNGKGEWMYDYVLPDPDPPPFTTIGWRLVHIGSINDMFYEHVFGPAARDYADQEVPHDAAAAITWWETGSERFLQAMGGLDDQALDRLVSTPWGVSQSVEQWVRTVVHENIHHGAEIGVLRDLHRLMMLDVAGNQ